MVGRIVRSGGTLVAPGVPLRRTGADDGHVCGRWAVGVEASYPTRTWAGPSRQARRRLGISAWRRCWPASARGDNRMEVFGRVGNVRVDWGRTNRQPAGLRPECASTISTSRWGVSSSVASTAFERTTISRARPRSTLWRQDGLVLLRRSDGSLIAEGNGGLLGARELDQESWFGGYRAAVSRDWCVISPPNFRPPETPGARRFLAWRF
jgi:hypothetical protein